MRGTHFCCVDRVGQRLALVERLEQGIEALDDRQHHPVPLPPAMRRLTSSDRPVRWWSSVPTSSTCDRSTACFSEVADFSVGFNFFRTGFYTHPASEGAHRWLQRTSDIPAVAVDRSEPALREPLASSAGACERRVEGSASNHTFLTSLSPVLGMWGCNFRPRPKVCPRQASHFLSVSSGPRGAVVCTVWLRRGLL